MFSATKDIISYRSALKGVDEHEQKDLCSLEHALSGAIDKVAAGEEYPSLADYNIASPHFEHARAAAAGAAIIGGGKVLKKVPGMGTVFDWRDTNWSQPNGGIIKLLLFVQHIPVVPNLAGIADFVRLRDVLVAQGLMVQNATDRDGNVALYTQMNRLCYQARGANQFSCGTEHMHMTIGETWSKQQLRASAWLVNQAKEKHDLPAAMGELGRGNGIARVVRHGQTSHRLVSWAAGFNDRVDPGPGYDWEYVHYCVVKYRERIVDGTADSKGFVGL